MNQSVVAIIPSAGMGKRFGGSIKKTYIHLGSVPVIIHTLLKFEASPKISEIVPVVAQEDRQYLSNLLSHFNLTKVTKVVNGGRERQDSVSNGLNQIEKADLVLIHDGVRPFVSCKLIDSLIEAVQGADGVIPVIAIRDTVKERSDSGFVIKTIDRERLAAVQTPQVFLWPMLKRAYEAAYAEGYYGTDDASLVERIGGQGDAVPSVALIEARPVWGYPLAIQLAQIF